jgi:hypothetical protein
VERWRRGPVPEAVLFGAGRTDETRPDPLAVVPRHVSSYVDRIRVKMFLKH